MVRVFDPVLTDSSKEMYERKHIENVYSLLDNMDEISKYLSDDWSFILNEWGPTFNRGMHPPGPV